MAYEGGGDHGKAERFRAAVLPYLDDVYTLARYLLRNAADAEDAAQECYLRAFRHFETFRGGPIKPWLLAILRNVCRSEYARRSALLGLVGNNLDEAEEAQGMGPELPAPRVESIQGFNIRRWSDQGLNLLAVSDLNPDELEEFGTKFEQASRSAHTG